MKNSLPRLQGDCFFDCGIVFLHYLFQEMRLLLENGLKVEAVILSTCLNFAPSYRNPARLQCHSATSCRNSASFHCHSATSCRNPASSHHHSASFCRNPATCVKLLEKGKRTIEITRTKAKTKPPTRMVRGFKNKLLTRVEFNDKSFVDFSWKFRTLRHTSESSF